MDFIDNGTHVPREQLGVLDTIVKPVPLREE
jgi:hypothetical protein